MTQKNHKLRKFYITVGREAGNFYRVRDISTVDTSDIKNDFSLPAPRPNSQYTGKQDRFYVYVILCRNLSLYIGQTQNLNERWREHCKGTAASWTKLHPPVEIVHYEEFNTRKDAVKRERELKTGFGRKWLKKLVASRQAGKTRDILTPENADMNREISGNPSTPLGVNQKTAINAAFGELIIFRMIAALLARAFAQGGVNENRYCQQQYCPSYIEELYGLDYVHDIYNIITNLISKPPSQEVSETGYDKPAAKTLLFVGAVVKRGIDHDGNCQDHYSADKVEKIHVNSYCTSLVTTNHGLISGGKFNKESKKIRSRFVKKI